MLKKENSNFFTIIISSYNGEKYITEQINSILNQTYINWELIIADDKSNDNTMNILENFCKKNSKITFYRNKNKLGPTESFFNLLHKSKGKYTIFCDQDDIWIPDKLLTLKNHINKENIIFGFHNARYLINNAEISKKLKLKDADIIYSSKPKLKFINLIFSNQVIGCLSFGETSTLQRLIKTTPLKHSKIYLDYWIALNISLTSEIFYINEILSLYRRHSSVATKQNRNLTTKIISRFFILISLIWNSICTRFY